MKIEVGIYHITIPHELGFVSYCRIPELPVYALTEWGKTIDECKIAATADLARFSHQPEFIENRPMRPQIFADKLE